MASKPLPASRAWRVAGDSVRGVSHLHDGRPNQDAIAKWTAGSGAPATAIVAIADGHGGARHFRSEIGARIAVDVTVKVLRELTAELDAATDRERSRIAATEIPTRIVAAWNGAARAHLATTPITDDERLAVEAAEGPAAVEAVRQDELLAYGATLLAALATESCIVVTQLGDGDVLAVSPDGTTTRPVPNDERLSGNRTTSLCRPGAEADFRVVALSAENAQAALLLLSTDGYANSFKSDADFLQVGQDFLDMIGKEGIAAVEAELPDILNHASANGSGDDITLGLLHVAADSAQASSTGPRSSTHASNRIRGTAGGNTQELARLDQRLQTAEQRIGSLRKALVGACLIAAIAVGWSVRDHLGFKLPWGGDVEKTSPTAGKTPAVVVKVPSGTEKPVTIDKPVIIDKPVTNEKPFPGEKPVVPGKEPQGVIDQVVMAEPTHSMIEAFWIARSDQGVEVNAQLLLIGHESNACSIEGSVWDAKSAKLASVTTKITRSRNAGPTSMPIKMLIPYHEDKRGKAMRSDDATASLVLSCDGKSVADTGRKAIGA